MPKSTRCTQTPSTLGCSTHRSGIGSRSATDTASGGSSRWEGDRFVGFVNVLWDGLVHAFIEDVMVDAARHHRGIGIGLVHAARDGAREAGCDFLHVGFEEALAPFYIDACGFTPTQGGLMELS